MADNDEHWRDQESQGNESIALREPWDRRPDESDKAWQAFVMFRDSENRSLTEIARSSNFECSVSNISRWCVLHNWKNRCFAYDADRDEKERAQLARDRMAMKKRHLQIAVTMQEIGVRGLLELKAKMAAGSPLGLTAGESQGLLDAGAKLERLTLGEGRDSRYTKINVIFGGYRDEHGVMDEQKYDAALIEGGNPRRKIN